MDINKFDKYLELAIQYGIEYGIKIVGALVIFIIGRWIVKKISSFIEKLMKKKGVWIQH